MDTDQLQPCECEYWPATTMLMLILTSYNHVGVDTDQLQPCEGGNEPATTMRGWLTSYKHVGVWMCILASYNHVRVDTDQLQQSGVNTDQPRPCEGGVSGYWPATTMWRWWILTCYNHVGVVTEKRQYCGVMRLIYWAGPTMWGWIRTSYNNVEGWYWPATQSGGEYWPATTMWEWCEWILSCYNHVGMVTYQLKPCGVMELIYWPATIMIWL